MSKLAAHTHSWYPISYDDGEPAVWACAVFWKCVKTITRKEHSRLQRKADREGKGSIDEAVPERGLWAITA